MRLEPTLDLCLYGLFGIAFVWVMIRILKGRLGLAGSEDAGPGSGGLSLGLAERETGIIPGWGSSSRRSIPGQIVRLAIAASILGVIGYCLYHGISLDQFLRGKLGTSIETAQSSEPMGKDWAMRNGLRWVYLVGTDSAGVGYRGWVSEFSFLRGLPEPTGEQDILSRMGLPSIKERLEGARQLRKTVDALNQALKNH